MAEIKTEYETVRFTKRHDGEVVWYDIYFVVGGGEGVIASESIAGNTEWLFYSEDRTFAAAELLDIAAFLNQLNGGK